MLQIGLMVELLNVDEAIARILADIFPMGEERVPLLKSLGRVLAEDIVAQEDLPLMDNSSMDGYAVRAADVLSAPINLRVVINQTTGKTTEKTIEATQAARIMTGAVIPQGADTVIPVEDTNSNWQISTDPALPYDVTIRKTAPKGNAIRRAGEDIQKGQLLLKRGTITGPAEIGILAATGNANPSVFKRPKVAIISSGNELIEPEEQLQPAKTRNANSYTLAALIQENGGEAVILPTATDTTASIQATFTEALRHQPNLILSSAGVSVGAADFVRSTLEQMGELNFWRINLRPGKPLAYGHLQGVPFFGLPGNPVSAMVTFEVIVRPALLKMGHRPDLRRIIHAKTTQAIQSDGRRSYLRVKLEASENGYTTTLTGTQSSGALSSMLYADGLLIIPEDVYEVPAETELPVILLNQAIR
ncbi:MAG: molybdopterin molybdotransferase MoeA [bacterium]|nr:molybdopterin molybdotransferase MoeA [bacterium]